MKILSVNISEKKGTIKKPVDEITINETGVMNDAHAGSWHRQVSMLGVESIKKFEGMANRKVNFGEFAENITTDGILIYKSKIFDRFNINEVELEVTQIGKECHGNTCAIFREVGDCVMPKEGIFCRVIKGGKIKAGDEFSYIQRTFKIAVITLSDRASRGEYTDRSGPKITEMIKSHFDSSERKYEIENVLIPDDEAQLKKSLDKFVKEQFDVIVTTGGTGIGSKDITVDIVKPLLQKEIPGIMDFIRFKYGSEKPNALISRSVAGLINKTMIFTLPGSVKAVTEYMTEINKVLNHLILMVHDIDAH
jgi:molybdopterin adenylyltransferase